MCQDMLGWHLYKETYFSLIRQQWQPPLMAGTAWAKPIKAEHCWHEYNTCWYCWEILLFIMLSALHLPCWIVFPKYISHSWHLHPHLVMTQIKVREIEKSEPSFWTFTLNYLFCFSIWCPLAKPWEESYEKGIVFFCWLSISEDFCGLGKAEWKNKMSLMCWPTELNTSRWSVQADLSLCLHLHISVNLMLCQIKYFRKGSDQHQLSCYGFYCPWYKKLSISLPFFNFSYKIDEHSNFLSSSEEQVRTVA